MGDGAWRTVEASHGPGRLASALPPAAADFEYAIEAQTASAETLRWPVTAPELNQTVVVN